MQSKPHGGSEERIRVVGRLFQLRIGQPLPAARGRLQFFLNRSDRQGVAYSP